MADERVEVRTDSELDAETRRAIRHLLHEAFDGEFSDDDWQHAVGGRHVVVTEVGELVAHAALVERAVWIAGARHEVGYVEAVATGPARQGRGYGTIAMEEIGRIIERRHGIGVLSTGECGFYERLGWQRWRGPSFVRRFTGGRVRTPDEDDGIMVLSSVPLDLEAPIECEERSGDDW